MTTSPLTPTGSTGNDDQVSFTQEMTATAQRAIAARDAGACTRAHLLAERVLTGYQLLRDAAVGTRPEQIAFALAACRRHAPKPLLRLGFGLANLDDPATSTAAKFAGTSGADRNTTSGPAGPSTTTPTTSPEDTMPASIIAEAYPHHPHFVSATPIGNRTEFTFRSFAGNEPEPTRPPYPEGAFENDKPLYELYEQRRDEFEVAHRLWETARYEATVKPLIAALVAARPAVDEALQEMQDAWKGLDNALVWEVAVKRVLDSHDAARKVMHHWACKYARPLADVEDHQSYYIREHVANWRYLAEQMGHKADYDIGSFWKDVYTDDPGDRVEEAITAHRKRLAEIAQFSGIRSAGKL